jgi:uncharacterized protein involved in exopolysaccharide biosynthesis/Mrp family chromosome partitioning ATPase
MDISVGSMSPVATPIPGKLQLAQAAKLLRRYFWLILACCLVGAVAAFALASVLTKSYTAASVIAVEGDRFAIPELQGALQSETSPDPMPWVRTEVHALSSRALVREVTNQLHLDQNPEFNAALRPPTLLSRFEGWLKSFFSGPPAPGGSDEPVLNAAIRNLVISQDNRSLVIGVAFTSHDPKLSAKFVNTLVNDYIASRASRRTLANQSANTVLAQQINKARDDLQSVEQQMRDLRKKDDLVGLRAGSVGQQQLEDLATAAANATLQRSQLQEMLSRATALAKQGDSDELANVLDSPTISRLREQEDRAAARVADLSSRYVSTFPGLRTARAVLAVTQREIADETRRIVGSLDARLRVARAHEADVQRQLNQARTAAVKIQNDQAELDQLKQDEATRLTLYQTLLVRAQQTVARPTGTETPDVRLLSAAVTPDLPSAPNKKMAGALGGFAGGIFGYLLAMARVRRLDGFAKPADVTEATNMPVLATVFPPSGRRARVGFLTERVAASPAGEEAEAMRLLRARLRRSGLSGVARSVAFTSATKTDAGDSGTADFAAAFARVAALDGDKVLLIDGNLRSASALSNMLNIPSTNLAAVLGSDADWRDVLQPDPEAPLLDLLLAAGDADPTDDPHAALSSVRFQNLLIEARDEYGLIVLNAPPAADTGALALAQRADATVVVVDGRRAKREETGEAATRLGGMSRNPIVAVMVGAATA